MGPRLADAADHGPTGPRAALAVISDRNFGPFFAGNAVSASGAWFHALAAGLLVFRETGSELLLGVLTFGQFLPMLLLAPWAGLAADRLDRKRLIVWAQVASAALSALLAALAWTGAASAWVVIGVSTVSGAVAAVSLPASQSLPALLVDRRDLATAVGLNSVTYNLARATGPALAGVTIASLGIPAAFLVNAGTYLALVAGLALVEPRRVERADAPRPRFTDTLRLVARDRVMAGLLLVVAVAGFASDPINTLSPAFAEAFGRRDTDAGFIVAVFGAGAITAALVLSGRLTGAARRLAATLALCAVCLALFSTIRTLPVALVFLFLAGFGYLGSNVAATARLQLRVGEHERGRVMALWTIAFIGIRPVASIVDGAVAQAAGVRWAGVALALPALAVAGALLTASRRSR